MVLRDVSYKIVHNNLQRTTSAFRRTMLWYGMNHGLCERWQDTEKPDVSQTLLM